MISKKIEDAMNAQLNAEMYSSYLYLAMAAYFEDANLLGFAGWMKVQAQEEMGHAMKFYGQINQRNGRVVLQAIDKPKEKWESPLAAFQDAFKHEQMITGRINDLAALADAEKDRASLEFLQWFIKEQVEEEASVDEVVQKLQMIKDAPGGLFMMDRALAARQAG